MAETHNDPTDAAFAQAVALDDMSDEDLFKTILEKKPKPKPKNSGSPVSDLWGSIQPHFPALSAAVRGGARGIAGTLNTLGDVVVKVGSTTDKLAEKHLGIKQPEELKQKIAKWEKGESKSVTSDSFEDDLDKYFPKSDHFLPRLIEPVAQYAIGAKMLSTATGSATEFQVVRGAAKVAKAGKLTKAIAAGSRVAEGALVDMTAFDGDDQNLADALQGTPILGTVTHFLAHDEDDGVFTGKLKNALAGALTSSTIEMFAGRLAARKALKAGKTPQEATKILKAAETRAAAAEAEEPFVLKTLTDGRTSLEVNAENVLRRLEPDWGVEEASHKAAEAMFLKWAKQNPDDALHVILAEAEHKTKHIAAQAGKEMPEIMQPGPLAQKLAELRKGLHPSADAMEARSVLGTKEAPKVTEEAAAVAGKETPSVSTPMAPEASSGQPRAAPRAVFETRADAEPVAAAMNIRGP
jgi:hypothetical protein